MAGHGKSMVQYDWLTAYETATKGMIELDEPIHVDHRGSGGDVKTYRIDTMESPIVSQESILIKKDAYLALSQEAKEVIEIIFNAPKEILECFVTDTYDKVSKRKIKNWLLTQGWNRKKVRFCFAELRDFSSNFG